MAVPSSGELELYGDIGTELGVAQSNVTLHGMSQTAGFSTPDAMSEFYGYSGVSSPLSTVLWTGNGGTQSITGVGFQPDLVWIKERTGTDHYRLQDTVRGAGYRLYSSTTSAEGYTNDSITSFNADGFSLGSSLAVNESGQNYVAWCWKAGGAAVTNNDGTISSQVSANVEGGFSVVSYTGVGSGSNRTVGHGLNQAPEIIIVKNRDGTQGWLVWTTLIDGSSDYLFLNSPGPKDNSGQALPTSTVFNIQNDGGGESNKNGNRYIGYCFHSVTGVSKFGTYTGNGSTNGSTVTTGFKPSFIMTKRVDLGSGWYIADNKRNPTDPRNLLLNINFAGTEIVGTGTSYFNFNSDGFQVTATTDEINANGGTYLYMAFA